MATEIQLIEGDYEWEDTDGSKIKYNLNYHDQNGGVRLTVEEDEHHISLNLPKNWVIITEASWEKFTSILYNNHPFPEPDWNRAPMWAQFCTIDRDGWRVWWEAMPEVNRQEARWTHPTTLSFAPQVYPGWRHFIFRRPNLEEIEPAINVAVGGGNVVRVRQIPQDFDEIIEQEQPAARRRVQRGEALADPDFRWENFENAARLADAREVAVGLPDGYVGIARVAQDEVGVPAQPDPNEVAAELVEGYRINPNHRNLYVGINEPRIDFGQRLGRFDMAGVGAGVGAGLVNMDDVEQEANEAAFVARLRQRRQHLGQIEEIVDNALGNMQVGGDIQIVPHPIRDIAYDEEGEALFDATEQALVRRMAEAYTNGYHQVVIHGDTLYTWVVRQNAPGAARQVLFGFEVVLRNRRGRMVEAPIEAQNRAQDFFTNTWLREQGI